jgi:glycosyltransferase involved in cell wall biosynthesis
MKFSIVTISFNQCQYLRACIESVLSQERVDVEYIVVDPGSSDGSRELIESYGDKIIRVFEKDAGPADGLNKGFAVATGDIYGFINSDDYLLPGALHHIQTFFETQPGGSNTFVTGHGVIDRGPGLLTPVFPTRLSVEGMLQLADIVFQQSTFFPAALYRAVGGFNVNNRTCWDYELFLRLLLQGATHSVIEPNLSAFRLYEGSISGSGHLQTRCLEDVDTLFLEIKGRERKFQDILKKHYLRARREINRKLRR